MTDDKQITSDEARAALEADRQARVNEMAEIIEREAERLRVRVVGVPAITADGRIGAAVQVLAAD